MAAGTPHVHETEGWVVYVSPNPVLLILPAGGSWVAATSHTGAKVDLCRRIVHGPDFVEFVDVELDVAWRWGEPARILDVEEFEALRLPDADAFLAEAERIRACVDAGEEPFGPAFRQRLLDVAAAGRRRRRAGRRRGNGNGLMAHGHRAGAAGVPRSGYGEMVMLNCCAEDRPP